MQRRDFLKAAIVAGATALVPEESIRAEGPKSAALTERLCLFTDHLDDSGYSYAEVASMLSQLKIAGPDLTVRAGGLVSPERVAEELPKAAAAFRDKGLS